MLEQNKYRIKVLLGLKKFTYRTKKFFIINFFLSIIAMALSFAIPFFYKIFIVEVIISQKISKMKIVLAGYVGIYILNLIILYIKNYNNNRIVNILTFRVKFKIWNNILKRDFASYENMNIGDLKMRIDDDTTCISIFSDEQSLNYLINVLSTIVLAIVLCIIEWRLALITILAIPLTFYLDYIVSQMERSMGEENRENSQKQSTWLHASIKGWREVKALNLKNHENKILVKFVHYHAVFFSRYNILSTTRILVLPKIKDEFFMQFITYFIGGILIINNKLSIGALLVFVQYYNMLANSVKTISTANANLIVNKVFIERMFDELNNKNNTKKPKKLLITNSSDIIFKDVSFKYANSEKEVLKNFNFTINDGERVAIIGKSGAGKSTILKLIAGIINPSSGKVLFSGQDVSQIKTSELYRRIGFVMQDNILFNCTIKENLLLGTKNITDEECDEACKKANIYDYISSLADGYNTIIGERGIKLSGGQRQRIILARLFLRDIDVYVFDEATSALDQHNESIIHDAILKISKEKTIIVAAHRQSSIDLCDRRINLNTNEVVNV
jgi:ABC-type bacteriocin/lantibiotic exporter with double-glycine peptidase domain